MSEFALEYLLFLAKLATVLGGLLMLVTAIISVGQRYRKLEKEGHIEITNLNDKYRQMAFAMKSAVLNESAFDELCKDEKKSEKLSRKAEKEQGKNALPEGRRRLFVVDFHGDIRASGGQALSECITAILSIARTQDEVVVRLESAGGLVHSYGLAASQLQRVREKDVRLTVAVDKVAASGGYMMACVGNRIIAAPFAILGSIGVLAQIPNFHRLLKKHDVDYEMLTAGEYKRTLTVLGENTAKARQKFQEDIDDTHALFKDYVSQNRPQLDMHRVATGETWFGLRALEQGLVDEIKTSESYLYDCHHDADIYRVTWVEKQTLPERIGLVAEKASEKISWKILSLLDGREHFHR